MNVRGKKKKNRVVTANFFEQQEIIVKAEAIKCNLKASTWHELETKGKFDKNKKLTFVSDDMLILGSETHYVRAIDTRGRELSKSAVCLCGKRGDTEQIGEQNGVKGNGNGYCEEQNEENVDTDSSMYRFAVCDMDRILRADTLWS